MVELRRRAEFVAARAEPYPHPINRTCAWNRPDAKPAVQHRYNSRLASRGRHRFHWTIDPLVNLLAHPAINITIFGALLLALVARLTSRAEPVTDQRIAWLSTGAVLHFLVLSFVLAIDPKPRMFLPQVFIAATVVGVLADRLWTRLPTILLLILIGARAVTSIWDPQPIARLAQPTVEIWMDAAGWRVQLEDYTARALALSPSLERLQPGSPSTMIALSAAKCPAITGAQWQLAERVQLQAAEPRWISWLRDQSLFIGPRPMPELCRYSR